MMLVFLCFQSGRQSFSLQVLVIRLRLRGAGDGVLDGEHIHSSIQPSLYLNQEQKLDRKIHKNNKIHFTTTTIWSNAVKRS